MDCRTARLLLDFHRPRAGELPADEAADLECHLAGCPECDAAGRAERRLDDHLGRAVRDVAVPDQLRERLLGRLKAERTAALKHKAAWTLRGAAVIAATLLIGTFVWWHYTTTPPTLDPYALAEADRARYDSSTPENVQMWFLEHHKVAMIAPKKFHYLHLAEYEMATLNGKPVPKLVFQRWDETGRTRARVFVLARGQFDLSDLPDGGQESETLGRKLTVQECPESADTRYLIIYEGGDLTPLLDPAFVNKQGV